MARNPKPEKVLLTDPPFTPASRRFLQAPAKERRRYARQLGEVAFAWNTAHAQLFRIFGMVVMNLDWRLAETVWHSHSTDRAQRAMLESAITVRPRENYLPFNRSHENAILWAVSVLNHLTADRNVIVHSDVFLLPGSAEPGFGVRPNHTEKIKTLPLDKNWRLLCGDLHGIANYLEGVVFSIMFGQPRPLSRRPRLLFSRSKTASSQERDRRAKKAARERQRQSSRR